MRELQSLLPELDPPPGGAARLRARLAEAGSRRRRSRRALRWAVAMAVPALALATLLPAPVQRWYHTRALTSALLAAMQPSASATGLRVEHGAALPLPSGQANVRLYLVQTSAGPDSHSSAR
jgi:hypothetical protein